MTPETWNWIATAIAVVAAAATIWQAAEARAARTAARSAQQEAEAAEGRAVDAAKRSADASERSAAAQEEQAAIARRAAERWDPPWTATHQVGRGSTTWRLTLGGPSSWHDITWKVEPEGNAAQPLDELPHDVMPGETVQWIFAPDFVSATQATVIIHGMPSGDVDGPRVQRITLHR